jgi:hypothetical protein
MIKMIVVDHTAPVSGQSSIKKSDSAAANTA